MAAEPLAGRAKRSLTATSQPARWIYQFGEFMCAPSARLKARDLRLEAQDLDSREQSRDSRIGSQPTGSGQKLRLYGRLALGAGGPNGAAKAPGSSFPASLFVHAKHSQSAANNNGPDHDDKQTEGTRDVPKQLPGRAPEGRGPSAARSASPRAGCPPSRAGLMGTHCARLLAIEQHQRRRRQQLLQGVNLRHHRLESRNPSP